MNDRKKPEKEIAAPDGGEDEPRKLRQTPRPDHWKSSARLFWLGVILVIVLNILEHLKILEWRNTNPGWPGKNLFTGLGLIHR